MIIFKIRKLIQYIFMCRKDRDQEYAVERGNIYQPTDQGRTLSSLPSTETDRLVNSCTYQPTDWGRTLSSDIAL